MTTPTLTPAYGRDHKSAQEVLDTFESDKDFIFNCYGDRYDGKPCNKSDLIRAGVTTVRFRFNNRMRTIIHTIEEDGS